MIIYPGLAKLLTHISALDEAKRHITLVFLCTRFREGRGPVEGVIISDEHQDFCWETIEGALDLPLTPVTQEVMEFLLD